MSYEGEVIGLVKGGVEVRQLTDAELAASGDRERRYCLVGHSHWNPASFFSQHADELEREARLYREAGMGIEIHRRSATSAEPGAPVLQEPPTPTTE
jgi:hypothetical protein